jgi:DNA-binding NarL/FixJ family response regulator
MPRILIADDHEIVREGVRALLSRSRPDWEISGEATNGREAIEAVKIQRPDVVLLDISMPVMNGLEAASQIAKLGVGCRTLIFTMHEGARLVDEVRTAGAQGYVQKSQAARDLVAAIEQLLSGGTFFDPQSQFERKPQRAKGRWGNMSYRSSLAFA